MRYPINEVSAWNKKQNRGKRQNVKLQYLIPGAILIFLALTLPAISEIATVEYGEGMEGQFYINDQPASPTSYHLVNDPLLHFKFAATAGGSTITRVYIELRDEYGDVGPQMLEGWTSQMMDETVENVEWTASGTLPAPGTYTLNGKVEVAGEWIYLMSVFGTWTGSTGEFTGQDISEDGAIIMTGFRLLLGLVGLGLVVIGIKPTARKRRLY